MRIRMDLPEGKKASSLKKRLKQEIRKHLSFLETTKKDAVIELQLLKGKRNKTKKPYRWAISFNLPNIHLYVEKHTSRPLGHAIECLKVLRQFALRAMKQSGADISTWTSTTLTPAINHSAAPRRV